MMADNTAAEPDGDRTPPVETRLARETLEDSLQLARQVFRNGNVVGALLDAERHARPDRPHMLTPG